MGTFSRIRYVIAANMNSLLEKAENPEKLLRALIREMEDAGEDARLAAADLLAEQNHLERLDGQLERETREWQERAEQAVEAGRDDLARAALKARAELVERRGTVASEKVSLGERVTQLETDMTTLKSKLADAKSRLKEMTARDTVKTPSAPKDEQLTRSERRIRSAMGRFDRLQSQVERLEARVRSYEVGGHAPSPWIAEELAADPAVEAELDEMKARLKVRNAPKAKSEPVQEADKA